MARTRLPQLLPKLAGNNDGGLTLWGAGQTILQGDVNGDKKADFSKAVDGIVSFIDTDFAL